MTTYSNALPPRRSSATAGTLIAMMLLCGTAFAAPLQHSEIQTAQNAQFSETDLRSFAVAVSGVNRIADVFQPKIDNAESSEEQEALSGQANAEMVKAIEGAGLTVEQFNVINLAAQNDPAVANQVKQYMNE